MTHVSSKRCCAALCLGLSVAAGCAGEAVVHPCGSGVPSPAPVQHARAAAVPDKVDLLLVVDNSASMADKQRLLANTAPDLLAQLAAPSCVDADGSAVATASQPSHPDDPCPAGAHRERVPITDVHVGIISTSLGSFGSAACDETKTNAVHMNDGAHLLAQRLDGVKVPSADATGVLAWRAATGAAIGDLSRDVQDAVLGAAETGCGYEAPLEAWYRFLVDPAPYERMAPAPCFPGDTRLECHTPVGVDQALLAQRKAFLRPDSQLLVVMLTDEDDCSVTADGNKSLALDPAVNMPRATSACATDPASPACTTCETPGTETDPACAQPRLSAAEDPVQLRCYRQKQRFGIDLLRPLARYVTAITAPTLDDGRVNPLYCATPSADGTRCDGPLRDPSRVLLAGIVGVPWQDVASDPRDLTRFAAGSDIRWDTVLGDIERGVNPLDPLMIDAVGARTGTQPLTGAPLAPAASVDPHANSINGHERDTRGSDLQYACTFPLPAPIDCNAPKSDASCLCAGDDRITNPLCQANDGSYDNVQRAASAYPARRILTVLRDVGPRGLVGSICAANTSDRTRPDFAFRPTVRTMLDTLTPLLAPQ